MAIIKLKRSDTPGNTPASLEHGEVAINIPDKKIYIGSGDTNDTAVLIVDGNAVGGGGYTAPTLGSTTLTSGATITSITGLSSVTSTSFVGALTGNASTVTNGVYTTDTGTVTNTMLAGSIANNKLTNSSITVNGSSISLGGSATVTANTTNALTIGTGLSGTSFNGSGAVTIAIDSTVATLTGGQTLTNKTISGSDNTLSNIPNASLTNSAITVNGSSISLGGSATVTATATNALTLGTGLTGTSYNGSTAVTAAVDTATIATRAYVDSVAQGLHSHATVKTATTDTLAVLTTTAVSYSGGAITWTGGKAATDASFCDGTTLTANNTESLASKILVKNEASGLGASKNGTYYVYAARELRRTSDGDTAADWAGGDFCFVTDGTLYNNTGWVQTEAITTLDTDSILWQQFSGAGSFTADETTLTLSGTQFSIKNTYVGQTSITTLGTIATGTWNATAIGATKGGTGQTVYAVGDLLYASTTTALSKLTIGANNYVLTSDGTNPVWTANTGTGNVVRASSPTLSSPTFTTPILGTPQSGTLTSCTGLPLTTGVTGTLGTANGGTNLTSFTSGGLLYASSTSVLTTGSVFGVTSSGTANRINISSGASPKANQEFKVSETSFSSSAVIGVYTDVSDNPPGSLGQGYVNLISSTGVDSSITLSDGTGSANISGGSTPLLFTVTPSLYGGPISVLSAVDNVTDPYVIFGDDGSFNGTSVIITDTQNTLKLQATTLKIATTTPASGKILTCTDSLGTASWTTSTIITRSVNNITGTTGAGSTAYTDYVYNVTSGTFTLTMPTAASNTNRYTIKQSGTGVLTIATTSSQTIDGSTTYTLNRQYQAIDLISDGSNWIVV